MGATAKKLAGIGGLVGGAALAPFTGGASLSLSKLALPLALAGGSAAASAAGSSGKQGSQKSSSIFDQTGESTSTEDFSSTTDSTQDINELIQTLERPEDEGFRKGLNRLLGQEFSRAQRPVFGDAQKASFLGDLNELGRSAVKNLSSSLAAGGRLDSGSFDQGIQDIELGRLGEASRFFGQLPFMEEQRRAAASQGLLGLGGQLASLAPRDQRRTGQTTGRSTTTGTGTRKGTFNQRGTQQGQQEAFGPSFLSGLLGNLGGLGGLAFGNLLGGQSTNRGGFPNVQGLPPRTPPFTPQQFYGIGGRR